VKNVTGMYVQQTRLFAPDVVPYRHVITSLGANRMRQALGFGSTNWQENLEYVFQDGTIEHQGSIVPITWASFHDRRILVQVLGNSSAAHAAYVAIRGVLCELNPDFQGAEPLILTEETSCSVQLDFDWTALLNPVFAEYVSQRVEDFSTEHVRRFLKGFTVRFLLGSEAHRALTERGITVSDQNLTIEPRADTPLSEQLFHAYSPCDSDTHLSLVSELEDKIVKQRLDAASRQKATKERPR